jgi:two-component sensor histidine kinase
MLQIDWVESGGPPASPPEREGFGTRLIRSAFLPERELEVKIWSWGEKISGPPR